MNEWVTCMPANIYIISQQCNVQKIQFESKHFFTTLFSCCFNKCRILLRLVLKHWNYSSIIIVLRVKLKIASYSSTP